MESEVSESNVTGTQPHLSFVYNLWLLSHSTLMPGRGRAHAACKTKATYCVPPYRPGWLSSAPGQDGDGLSEGGARAVALWASPTVSWGGQ